jgi:hypothetical protein
MVQLTQKFLFVHHRIDRSLGDDAGLGHLLHGKKFFLFSHFYFPHFAEATTTDDIHEMEAGLILS